MQTIAVTGNDLTFDEVVKVAEKKAQVELGNLEKVQKSAEFIQKKALEEKPIYGVTTGFGANADKFIEAENAKELQVNLLRSHATGVGNKFSEKIVRAMMLIRLNTLMKGYSGVREEVIKQLRDFLNYGIHPVIPEQGSLGASGDLCPLSHLALAMIGEGYLEFEGEEYKSEKFFKETKLPLKPLELSYKEGLALNNGTSLMAALGTFACYEFERLLELATLTSALMFEAFCARKNAFDDKIHQIRQNLEQIEIARWIRKFTDNSDFVGISVERLREKSKTAQLKVKCDELVEKKQDFLEKLAKLKEKPQDAYSFRCVPQVFGASLQALNHAKTVFSREINAAVDNPLLFVEEDEVISGGNFHGQPLALVLDYLKLAIAETGNLIERQINKLHDGATNDLLNPFLVYDEKHINSGLMISQYVAASLVSENKVLVHPASADSIPTCANTEDHVSMGATAGRQALEILKNVKNVLIIAVLTAHHAAQIRHNQFSEFNLHAEFAKPTKEFFDEIKKAVSDFTDDKKYLHQDRFLHDDLKNLAKKYDDFVKIAERNLE